MKNNDIIFESTQTNIRDFMKGKDSLELIELYFYITSDEKLKRPPTEMEKEFIGEFFTYDGWARHVQEIKYPSNKYFIPRDKFDLPMITSILAFEMMGELRKDYHLTLDNSAKFRKEKEKLKKELEESLENSYEDGIFDKVEGFSNLYETLVNNDYVIDKRD